MHRFNRERWKEKQEEERLREKYGENWRIARRAIRDFKKPEKPSKDHEHSFADLLNIKYHIKERPNP